MKTLIVCAVLALSWMTGCTTSHGGDTDAIRSAISDCYDLDDPARAESCLHELEGESTDADVVFGACFEEHFACAELGVPELCEPYVDDCFDVYGDPADLIQDVISVCYLEAEHCTRELGIDAGFCLDTLGFCLGTFDDPPFIDDGGDIAEVCFDGHVECLSWAGDPTECDFVLDDCLQNACVVGGPVEYPGDPCLEGLELCYESAATPWEAEACDMLIDGCWDDPAEPPVEPCVDATLVCFETAPTPEDATVCEDMLDTCVWSDPPWSDPTPGEPPPHEPPPHEPPPHEPQPEEPQPEEPQPYDPDPAPAAP